MYHFFNSRLLRLFRPLFAPMFPTLGIFAAAGSAIAVGLGAAEGGAIATAAGSLGGALGRKLLSAGVNKLAGGNSSGQVNNGQIPYTPLDVNKVITDSRQAASDNYQKSLDLLSTFNPDQAAMNRAATTRATDLVSGSLPSQLARDSILPQLTDAAGRVINQSNAANPLLSESADQILADLRSGGALPADVQREIMRSSLSKGGQAGLFGSNAQRGLTAADIGSNSLALRVQRQQAAQGAGSLMEQLGFARQAQNVSNLNAGNSVLGGLNGALSADSNAILGGYQGTLGYGLPASGLSPTNIASIYAGNQNAINQNAANQFTLDQQNANVRSGQLNQLLGFGSTLAGGIGKLGSSVFGGGGGGDRGDRGGGGGYGP